MFKVPNSVTRDILSILHPQGINPTARTPSSRSAHQDASLAHAVANRLCEWCWDVGLLFDLRNFRAFLGGSIDKVMAGSKRVIALPIVNSCGSFEVGSKSSKSRKDGSSLIRPGYCFVGHSENIRQIERPSQLGILYLVDSNKYLPFP